MLLRKDPELTAYCAVIQKLNQLFHSRHFDTCHSKVTRVSKHEQQEDLKLKQLVQVSHVRVCAMKNAHTSTLCQL